jgi:hypothetical protein
MTDEQVGKLAIEHFARLMRALDTRQERSEAIVTLLHLSYELLRGIEGEQFVAAWLEAALEDLTTTPPKLRLRELH